MPKAAQFFPDQEQLASESGIDLTVCQCAACGLVQLLSDPVDYYREVVRAAAVSEEMKSFRFDQFSGFISDFGLAGKKMIEIGCGGGDYLSVLQQCDVAATGLEYGKASVAGCRQQGLSVVEGYLDNESTRIEGGPYDAFMILNFLEHMPAPKQSLLAMVNNLTDIGVGLVEVPNFDMILRQQLFSEFIQDHLFYFTQSTLCALLQQSGFEVLDCREIWHDYILSATVRKRPRQNLSHFVDAQVSLKEQMQAYVREIKAQGGRVAVWGAGHQALAVIALTEIGGLIEYVIDSAKFKQGKFTPATHVPTVGPEKLLENDIQALIIMAGSYSEEVAGIARKTCGSSLRISVLGENGLCDVS